MRNKRLKLKKEILEAKLFYPGKHMKQEGENTILSAQSQNWSMGSVACYPRIESCPPPPSGPAATESNDIL